MSGVDPPEINDSGNSVTDGSDAPAVPKEIAAAQSTSEGVVPTLPPSSPNAERPRSGGPSARNLENRNAQYMQPDAGGLPRYDIVPISSWRTNADPQIEVPSDLVMPCEPGFYIISGIDVRSIVAAVRAVARPEAVALDLGVAAARGGESYNDGRSLLGLLEGHRSGLVDTGQVCFFPGERGNGSAFWEEDIDVARLEAFCAANNLVVVLAGVGQRAEVFTKTFAAERVIAIDDWPLVAALTQLCPDVAEQVEAAWPKLARAGLAHDVIRALDSRADDEVLQQIELADQNSPDRTAREFINKQIACDDAATIALAFTAVAFGELPAGELRTVAQDLLRTPDLQIDVSLREDGTKPAAPRIDDRVRREIGIVSRARVDGFGVTSSLMTLKQGGRFAATVRRLLADEAPMISAALVDQLSRERVHGAVGFSAWKACCEVVSRVIVNEGEVSPEALATRLAAFWLSDEPGLGDGAVLARRAERLAQDGDRLLDELCAAVAQVTVIDRRHLQIATALALIPRGAAANRTVAWRSPAVAAYLARVLSILEDDALAEQLLQATLDGPPELATLLVCMLSGGFGFSIPLETEPQRLDRLLLTFAQMAGRADDLAPSVRKLVQAMTWRLMAIRVAHDAQRLAEALPVTASAELSAALNRAAAVLPRASVSDRLSIDGALPAWLETDRFDNLAYGWRLPPSYYLEIAPGDRSGLLAGESAFLLTNYMLRAVMGPFLSSDERLHALSGLSQRLGLPARLALEAVGLWIPLGDDDLSEANLASIEVPGEVVESLNRGQLDIAVAERLGIDHFINITFRLRNSAGVLACALANAECSMASAATNDLAESGIVLDLDREDWRCLAKFKDAARDTHSIIYDAWRDSLSDLHRSTAVKEAKSHARALCQALTLWWTEMQKLRATN